LNRQGAKNAKDNGVYWFELTAVHWRSVVLFWHQRGLARAGNMIVESG
jgi:hypothetical protein